MERQVSELPGLKGNGMGEGWKGDVYFHYQLLKKDEKEKMTAPIHP